MSPTQRTLAWLRERGYQAQVVEKWNPHARVRQDLFGWIDIVAIGPPLHDGDSKSTCIFGFQACAGASHAARVAKASPLVGPWNEAGGFSYVISWAKRGERGKRKVWTPRIELL